MLGPTQRVDELHLLNGVAGDFEETRARKDDGQATGAANGDVKAVAAVKKLDVAWDVAMRQMHVVVFGTGTSTQRVHGLSLPQRLLCSSPANRKQRLQNRCARSCDKAAEMAYRP